MLMCRRCGGPEVGRRRESKERETAPRIAQAAPQTLGPFQYEMRPSGVLVAG